MKKYILFTLKALGRAFYVSVPVIVFVMCFSDCFYGRNIASSTIRLWTKVTTVDPSENAQMPDANYVDSQDVVILTPEQFKRNFGHGDVIVVSLEPQGSMVRYRADKGRMAFTTSEKLSNPPDGTHIVQMSPVSGGSAIRIDLGPESIMGIMFISLFLSLVSVGFLFIGMSIVSLIGGGIILQIRHWHSQRTKLKLGSTVSA
jgi:hypothetical protein